MNPLKCSLLIVFLIITVSLSAQQTIEAKDASIVFTFNEDGGKNSSAVVYNPDKELYYAVIAGNANFPLETFNSSGIQRHGTEAGSDIRGMWYNTKTKHLEANCYGDGGIVKLHLNANGYAAGGDDNIFNGAEHQPFDNACGAFDPKKKEILYLDDGYVKGYSRKNGERGKTHLRLQFPVNAENINYTTLIYTGEKKMELGVLDYYTNKVYLFNKKSGEHTATIILPTDIVTYDMFRFSYANGKVFLYNADTRTWTGYNVF